MMVADSSDSKEFIVVSIRKSDDCSEPESGEQAEEEEENPAEEDTTEKTSLPYFPPDSGSFLCRWRQSLPEDRVSGDSIEIFMR